MTLKDVHISPSHSNRPQKLVVLLHGYGANGHDLLSLAEFWRHELPHALFVSPHAPFICESLPTGFQWFSLKGWEPGTEITGKFSNNLLEKGGELLNAYLDELLNLNHLKDQDMALVGFSQGTMMALDVALRRERPCAGVLGYSGAYIPSQDHCTKNLPIYLLHGQEDPVVPLSAMKAAENALRTLGLPVETKVFPGVEHTIVEEGVLDGGWFLKQILENRHTLMHACTS